MPTNPSIQTLLGDVVGSTGHRYAVTDSAGNTMDTVKIITNPAGGYLGVYHTGDKVNLASSTDLLSWVFRRTLDVQATQPTISALIRGKLDGFSTERLFLFLNALGRDVEIFIRPKPQGTKRARVRVFAATES